MMMILEDMMILIEKAQKAQSTYVGEGHHELETTICATRTKKIEKNEHSNMEAGEVKS